MRGEHGHEERLEGRSSQERCRSSDGASRLALKKGTSGQMKASLSWPLGKAEWRRCQAMAHKLVG